MDVAYKLAEFIVNTQYEDIPKFVIEEQKKSIVDAVGITLGASTLGDGCRDFVEMAEAFAAGGKGEATVIGFDKELPAIWAAFANASMAHSLDFGDTNQRTPLHSNASTFPAALAVAQSLGNVSGKELITALVIGSEVACRVSSAILSPLEKYGFYMPPILTSFGATAAVCKLLKLDVQQIVDAFSFNIAQTTCSSELMNAPKTVVRSVREAFAAKNAIIAAYAGKRGLAGFTEPFEGKNGFYNTYVRGAQALENVAKDLGTDWLCESLYFKLWPSCGGTHGSISAMLQIREKYNPNPEDIESVVCEIHERDKMLMEPLDVKRAPQTSMVGKFSIPYTASTALVSGSVSLSDFEPEAFNRPAIKKLASKFNYVVNYDWKKGGLTNVTVTMKDGTVLVGNYVRDTSLRTPFDKVVEKMKSCAKFAYKPFTDEELDAIVEAVRSIDTLENIDQFTKLL